MSGFPKPKMGTFGQGVYDIPTSHCSKKQWKVENCSEAELKERILKKGTGHQTSVYISVELVCKLLLTFRRQMLFPSKRDHRNMIVFNDLYSYLPNV
jgi:hypothetical protein